MSDSNPTAAPTSAAGAGVGQALPPAPPATPPLVSAAQVPNQEPQLPATPSSFSNDPDIAQYEQRVRAQMSRADKAIADQQKAIAKQIEMQEQWTQYQAQSQAQIQAAAESAQRAIDRQKELELQNQQLLAQSLRAQAIIKRPHLAQYAQFLPLTTDEAAIEAAANDLDVARQRDIDAARNTNPFAASAYTPTTPGIPSPQQNVPPVGNINNQQQLQNQGPNVMNLYNQRPAVQGNAPTIPSAIPSQMNPLGAADNSAAAIADLYKQAKATGDPAKMQAAHQQAIKLAEQSAQQQIMQGGRW